MLRRRLVATSTEEAAEHLVVSGGQESVERAQIVMGRKLLAPVATPSRRHGHVHLWSAEELPLWLNDPALASIACSRSVADFVAEAGTNLERAVYMEVDVAPAAREREAQTVTALCADDSNPLVGAVIGAPVVEGTVEEFACFVREWAGNRFVKGVRQVLHTYPQGTCLRDDVVAKAQLCGEDLIF